MRQKVTIGLIALLMCGVLLLSSCSSKNPELNTQNRKEGYPNPAGEKPASNLTEEQRQQMVQEQTQHAEKGGYPNRTGERPGSNLSEEDRQQMMQEMTQQATEACQDKAEGDVCSISSPMGDREGTCNNQDGKLLCSAGMGGRQVPPDAR